MTDDRSRGDASPDAPAADARADGAAPSGSDPEGRTPQADGPERGAGPEGGTGSDALLDPSEELPLPELDVRRAVLRVLRYGPATSYDVARRLDETHADDLHRHEGQLLALLHLLRRDGVIEAAWADRSDGRRRMYRLPPRPAPVETQEETPPADDGGARTEDSAATPPHPLDTSPDPGERADASTSGVPTSAEGTPAAPDAGALAKAATPESPDARSSPERDDAAAADAPPPRRRPASADFHRVADDATRRLEFAPRLAAETRAEILAHLQDLAESPDPDEERAPDEQAVRRFGDPWKVGLDLSRVARGRPTVLFPRTLVDALRSLAIYEAGIVAAIVAVILFLRIEVVAAYHIPTKSMEPTLHGERAGGDRILVFRLSPKPERFDIVVFEGWDQDRRQYVKRCVGLPGEWVRTREGDLWVDGHLIRKEGSALDAMLFPLFDVEATRKAAARGGKTTSKRVQTDWAFDGGRRWAQWPDGTFDVEADAGGEPAILRWDDRFDDALYDAEEAERTGGIVTVGDGRLTVDVTPADETSRVVLRWARGDEVFEAVLQDDRPGVSLRIDGTEVERNASVSVPPGRTTRVRLSHVDHVVRVEVGGDLVLRRDMPEPDQPPSSAPGATVSVQVRAGKASVLPVKLERDVHWTTEYDSLDRGHLLDDQYFMLGDNSSNSQDSRARGPVHESRLIGKPILVVWPFSRIHVPR